MTARRYSALLATATVAAATLFVPSVASAHGNHHPDPQPATLSEPIAQGLVGPLQIEVDGRTVYIAQSFAGVLTKVTKHGSTDIVSNPGGEISGVAVKGKSVFYTAGDGVLPANTVNRLRKGESSPVADTLAYEQANNPDGGQSYGIEQPLSDDCAAQWPVDQAGPPTYTGLIDSHAYALAIGDDEIYIADAGANAILALGRDGELRTVAVLPPQPTVISAEAAAANGLPACVVGLTYNFEAVPTDVEVGHDGKLYVTTLPGGPEDPSLGARGSVYRVSPYSGRVKQVATGFLGATNLALAPHGDIYVTELFGGRVSKVVDGGPETLIELPAPAGLEYANGKLYVAYDVFPPENAPPNGIVATIDIGRDY
jgi:hypothetical protein